jgi:hypothetical protein
LLQYPGEINGDNLNNIRHEASRHFRNEMREYLKDKIHELAMNSKNKNIRDLYRGINDFKRGCQTRSNLEKIFFIIVAIYNLLNIHTRVISKWDECRYLKQVPSSDGSLEFI